MADTESLGEAGVRWLEGLAAIADGQRRVRIPTITDPRGTDFAKADFLGHTKTMLDLERRAIAAFVKLGVTMTDTCINYQTIQAPMPQRACRLWRYRRGDLFQLGMWRALQFRRRTVRACRRTDRTHAALRLSSRRTASCDSARPRRLHSRHAQRMGRARRRDRAHCRQLLGRPGDRRASTTHPDRISSSISAPRWRASVRPPCFTSSASPRKPGD